jgi:hypothetical protein
MKQTYVAIPFSTVAEMIKVRETLRCFGYPIFHGFNRDNSIGVYNCVMIDKTDASRGRTSTIGSHYTTLTLQEFIDIEAPQPQPKQPQKEIRMTPAQKLGYKLGDKFRVLEGGAGFAKGAIITLDRDDGSAHPMFAGPNSSYKLAGPTRSREGAYFTLARVEKVVDFKVGDKIRVLRGSKGTLTSFHSSNIGRVGTVTALDIGSNLDILVEFSDTRDWGRSSDAELVEVADVVVKSEFKVGDRVIIIAITAEGFERESLNKIGKIRHIDGSSLPALVDFDDGESDWGTFEEMRNLDTSGSNVDAQKLEQKLAQIEALVEEVRGLVR